MMKVLIDYEASVEGKYRNVFSCSEDVTEKSLTKYLTFGHLSYHFCSPASECQIPFLPNFMIKNPRNSTLKIYEGIKFDNNRVKNNQK